MNKLDLDTNLNNVVIVIIVSERVEHFDPSLLNVCSCHNPVFLFLEINGEDQNVRSPIFGTPDHIP